MWIREPHPYDYILRAHKTKKGWHTSQGQDNPVIPGILFFKEWTRLFLVLAVCM